MSAHLVELMSSKTDEELIKIVTEDRDKYQPIAIEIAEAEVNKRNIPTIYIQKIERKAKEEGNQMTKKATNLVSSGIRLIHFCIDSIICIIVAFILLLLTTMFITLLGIYVEIGQFIIYPIIFAVFFGYYVIMEVKFQKTVGKMLTKTTVVTQNEEKPTISDIMIRTIGRIIPFDQISYLFTKIGIHDYISKTKVIKDIK